MDGTINRSETLSRLKIKKLYNQYVFCSGDSLEFINFVSAIKISHNQEQENV